MELIFNDEAHFEYAGVDCPCEGLITNHRALYGSSLMDFDVVIGVSRSRQLSEEFVDRILQFVSWEPKWDGRRAKPIAVPIAKKATLLARKSLVFAPEPFVAPAPDGSILLQWDLKDGSSVELFVEDGPYEAATVVNCRRQVREVPINDEATLMALLATEPQAIAITA